MERAGSGPGRQAPEGLPRFQCPPDFCRSPFAPEVLQGPSKELWLIRAPADFSPESLDGRAVPLVGFQTLKMKLGGTRRLFDVHGALREPGSPHLLVSSARSGQLSCAASFHGCMSICERFGDPSSGSPPQAVTARPAPQVMEGLKQRFLPFGGSPKCRCPEEAAMSSPATDTQAGLGPARKKKKKRVKEEPRELPVSIKQEPPGGWESSDPGPQPPAGEDDGLRGAEEPTGGDPSHRHKKKKKKKHKYEALDGGAWPLLDPSAMKREPSHPRD
ncbi:DNA-directed RNA polymerase I subunit RPA34 [Emydura macquarii macquarii]|uniref:DNA-directed RNA polymerase I subunit RPA34 n=1 Tax=Emydura macquarii macquarii TaxID=1129001 RepID=UPI00352A9636